MAKIGRQKKKQIKVKKEKFIPQSLKGMRDILPEEGKYFDYFLEKLEKLAKIYGFEKIEIPILEEKSLFTRSIGQTTDIVEKEMFSFVDKGGREVALRPEGTAGVVRAYIENGMQNLPQPVKLYYFGPMFRYEKPQAGRERQFHQFGLEVLGAAGPIVDVQLILLCWNFFQEIKLQTELQINCLGCPDCQKEYRRRLLEFFRYKKRLLCPNCRIRLEKSPLRIFDCKEKKCQEISSTAPSIVDCLCEACKNHFIKVLENLDELEIPYNLNSRLVRGLDYYTKTVFEFWPSRIGLSDEEKSRFSLAGGGRYDNLVKILGGPVTPAAGVAFGLERITEEFKNQNLKLPKERRNIVFLAQIGETAKKKALHLFENLVKAKIDIKEALAKDSLKAQLELANKIGAKLVLILGQDEVAHKTIIIKDMRTGIQEVVNVDKIVEEIKKRL